MGEASFLKVCFVLGVLICLGSKTSADNENQYRSKFKYGYVISHEGGISQAHLESRDGNLALGRYYVNLHNGTGQKVTYFADDLGFHTGVSYSNQNGQGSSKTQIAMGQKALAAFGDSEIHQNSAVTVSSPTLLFGKKIQKAVMSAVTPKPEATPKFNYTPVSGGFFLTHESLETSNGTTEHPSYIASLTSPKFSPNDGKYSEGVLHSKANTQTFYPTSENVENEIKELHIHPTTPSIKSYPSVPQHGSVFFGAHDEAFSQKAQTVKVSNYANNFDDLSYTKQKSIEKTNFTDIDAQIISEVQKHAEQIIMKDLHKSQNQNLQQGSLRFSLNMFQPSTITMKPIIVTNNDETGFNYKISTTSMPNNLKIDNNLQSGTINSVKITEKNLNQALEDTDYFRISSSSSLDSSINVSQTPHQSINADFTDLNLVTNNSTSCKFSLCQKDSKQIFSVDSKLKKELEESSSLASDISDGSGTNKVVQTFYPRNKLHDEKHYITTIDVQKAISLNVSPSEVGSINLAQNFPFNKVKPFNQPQNQHAVKSTSQPFISDQVAVTPSLFLSKTSPNFQSTPHKPYFLNTVTIVPELFSTTPNQNLEVLHGLNDVPSSQIEYNSVVQDRIGNNRLGYENQLVVPPSPVVLTNVAGDEFRQNQEDLKQVEKNIEELRQQILSSIDAQHEEHQKKQNLVDEERKQYFENLKKVEALKNQNSHSHSTEINSKSVNNNNQAKSLPVSSENVNNVGLILQNQYVPTQLNQYEAAPQPHYEPEPQALYDQATQNYNDQAQQTQFQLLPQTQYIPSIQTFQTEIKDFTHEVVVPGPSIQQTPSEDVYQKQIISYPSQNNGPRQQNVYDIQDVYAIDNKIQQSAPPQTTEKIQLTNLVSPIAHVAFRPQFAVPQVTPTEESKNLHQLSVLNRQLNTVALSLGTEVVSQTRVPESKTLLIDRVVPVDYSKFLQDKQPPLSLLQTYPVPIASETKISKIYPQQLEFPIQIPQMYKLITYPQVAITQKQYHSTLTQKPTNKLRVQPLKPSTPDDGGQREAVQNLLSQSQFHPTFYYTEFPFNNRLQLRHIRKNQISNSDQVRSQSVKRGKSLKNLRIEYGFKPPLRPSVEFSEEVKPSIYGPSVPPH